MGVSLHNLYVLTLFVVVWLGIVLRFLKCMTLVSLSLLLEIDLLTLFIRVRFELPPFYKP